jgi:hypothetical protein
MFFLLSNYFLVNLLCRHNIWLFCQISKSISPYGLPEGASSCPEISKFLGCPKPEFFFYSAKTSAPNFCPHAGLEAHLAIRKVMWTTWQTIAQWQCEHNNLAK